MKSDPETSENELPSYPIRPGVTFPNWSVVTSPVARDALLAIFEVFDLDKCWGGYSEAEDTVRIAVLLHYCKNGTSPNVADLVASCGTDEEQVLTTLGKLQDRDLVVLDEGGT